MSNKNNNDDGYCTLRVPITTRTEIERVANQETFKPNWTIIANQMLLQGVKQYFEENSVAAKNGQKDG